MTQPPTDNRRDRPLNRSLKSETDSSHDIGHSPAPLETTEAKEGDGEGWPVIWAVVTIICIIVALYLIF